MTAPLFSPFDLGPVRLSNRIVVVADVPVLGERRLR